MNDWRPSKSSEIPVFKVALGVAIGMLVAGFIGFAVRAWMVQQAAAQFQQQMQDIARQNDQRARAAAERARAEQIERARLAQESAANSRAALAAQQRADNAARQAVQDEAVRREQAWAKFYRKPARCNDAPSNETMVECANEFIRAKRAFEAAYAQGKL